MVNQNIRLIYSSDSSDKKNCQKRKKHLVQSDQLGLFDDFKTIRIIFIPVADISSHLFINTLEKNEPYILLDTREFPDFFSVFVSTDYALDEFKKHGIQYQRLPISLSSNNKEESWEQLSKLKTILDKHLEKKTNSPIVVLSSTSSNLNRVSDKLIGYIKQEVNQVTFEHITD